MNTPFCKLFDTHEYGQVLVMCSESPIDGFPALRFFVMSEGDLYCMTVSYNTPEVRDKWFNNVDGAMAPELAKRILDEAVNDIAPVCH